ncbi:hypothetical protein HH214_21390 [Mucilaginibacter robiniae]|uniref:Uncharacterized protein n=1 Tax=Mucilaginibacter robiniae TaxID=2728022 RepID=A0A7L5E6H3_9SPHI|nr:hypothetical protein [Mucilaginibacter robiniae]QJD98248.1 hypothetical protein HH214_21390 [Mucilaginibacter robiniae]
MKKVSFKTYLNDRLKEVNFHGQPTYPLYVQVTYERKTIFFKSYYFELFTKPRFAVMLPDGSTKGPDVALATKKEEDVIRFVIGKLEDDFSLEAFRKLYAYFSRDICEAMEVEFIDYLYVFFEDKKLPNMAELIKWGTKHVITYDLMTELQNTLDKALYQELIDGAFEDAPPYVQMYSFMLHIKNWPELCLTAMEWYNLETVQVFKVYVEEHFSDLPSNILIKQVDNWPHYRRKL